MKLARPKLLLAMGCLLAAGAAAIVIAVAALRSPSPGKPEARAAVREETLDRSPVEADVLEPAPPPVRAQHIERSQLPLVLLGTFAASDPSLSRATLRHRESQKTVVVRVGDEIEGRAVVEEIERERVVLREGGSRRELQLEGEPAPSDASVAAAEEPEAPAASPSAERSFESVMAELEGSMLDSTRRQAHVIPEVEGEQLVGLRFSEIQEGTRFAQMGIQEGDVITEFNGVSIDSPLVALHVVREMQEGASYRVMVRRDGVLTEYFGQKAPDS